MSDKQKIVIFYNSWGGIDKVIPLSELEDDPENMAKYGYTIEEADAWEKTFYVRTKITVRYPWRVHGTAIDVGVRDALEYRFDADTLRSKLRDRLYNIANAHIQGKIVDAFFDMYEDVVTVEVEIH